MAYRIEERQFSAGVIGGGEDFRMIARAGKNADALLEKRRGGGSEIGQRIGRRVPERQQGFGGDGLAQAHHGLAIRKGEDFKRTAENRAGQRSESGQRVAVPDFQSRSIDGDRQSTRLNS